MTREDIDNIISIICPNDEDFEKAIISPAYLKKELEALALEQEPTTKIEESNFSQEQYKADLQCAYDCGKSILDKIRAEILDCLKALDEIEKSGLNIYLPNEMSGRRLTYQQCLQIIDKYRAETENT